MAKKAVFKYFQLLMVLITVFCAIVTFVGLFGGNTNPASQGGTSQAMFCFALPLILVADAVLLIFWLVQKKWILAALPLIAMLSCVGYVGTIFRIGSDNADAAKTEKSLKVATYNVSHFGVGASKYIASDILEEMKAQQADILCLQEYQDETGDAKNSEKYKETYPYMAEGVRGDMVIYSKYPIKDFKATQFEETNNNYLYADIDVKGKIVRVFNVHMQTTGINRTLHHASKAAAQGKVESSAVLRAIYGNYMLDLMIRAGQSHIVANEIRSSQYPVILAGDFNDVPYSYVYKTLKGNLKDGFCDAGGGWMHTYRGKKAVRIDYVFYDQNFKGVSYYTKDLTYSDHVPVFSMFEI